MASPPFWHIFCIVQVPYGVLLSGGLDSSLVASIANREYKSLGNVDKLRSFCIGLKGSPDIAAAEKVTGAGDQLFLVGRQALLVALKVLYCLHPCQNRKL